MRRLALSLALLTSGCGWQTGLIVPEGSRTVGVEFFDNQTLEPDIEAELSIALGRSLVRLVDVPIVPAGQGDLVIRGVLVEFRRRPGTRNRENRLLETGVHIDVRAELVRRGTGEVLATSSADIWSNFAVDQPLNELAARERALDYIADQVVLDLFTPRS